eukprot:gene9537-biopygen8903
MATFLKCRSSGASTSAKSIQQQQFVGVRGGCAASVPNGNCSAEAVYVCLSVCLSVPPPLVECGRTSAGSGRTPARSGLGGAVPQQHIARGRTFRAQDCGKRADCSRFAARLRALGFVRSLPQSARFPQSWVRNARPQLSATLLLSKAYLGIRAVGLAPSNPFPHAPARMKLSGNCIPRIPGSGR